MITVSGNLKDIFGVLIPNATIVVQLCGFGATLPRVSAAALIAKTGQLEVNSADGTFSFAVYGNDVIEPAGTYYTVTVKDENGDVVQTEAYQFSGIAPVDLSAATPLDPAPFVGPAGVSYVPQTRIIATTAPLTGGGALGMNRTFAVSKATGASVGVVKPDSATIAVDGDGVLSLVIANFGTQIALPTADPHVAGAWWSNAGVVTVSAG